jgi:cysteine synthase A
VLHLNLLNGRIYKKERANIMAKIYGSVSELIGKTPLVELKCFAKSLNLNGKIYAKLESQNPLGSIKDRVALTMLNGFKERGQLKVGGTVIEPTSGNTGIAVASLCATMGYKAIIVMPENMSRERIAIMKQLGAQVVLTPKNEGMSGAIKVANEIKENTDGAVILSQFDNPDNKKAHRETTAKEIIEDTDAEFEIFVAGIGTGGTISGIGEYFKECGLDIYIVGAEPQSSAVLSGDKAGTHAIQGIGAGFIPKNLTTNIYNEIVKVSDDDAYKYAKLLAKTEGLLVGISSGAALYATVETLKRKENEGKRAVCILPDGAEKYLSTPLFDI